MTDQRSDHEISVRHGRTDVSPGQRRVPRIVHTEGVRGSAPQVLHPIERKHFYATIVSGHEHPRRDYRGRDLARLGAKTKEVRRVSPQEGLFIVPRLDRRTTSALGVGAVMVIATENALRLTLLSNSAPRYVGWSLVFTLIDTLIVIFFPLRRAARMKRV